MWSLVDYVLELTPYAYLAGGLHPIASIIVAFALFVVVYLMGRSVWDAFLGRSRFVVQGKHVLITGGSQGLGRALGVLMARKGAHVTLVARKRDALQAAAEEVEKAKFSTDQVVSIVSADVTEHAQVVRAFDEASAKHDGRVPEIIFTCAGAAKPGIFVEQSPADFVESMKLNYFGSLYTAHEAAKRMAHQGVKGEITFVSSILGFVGFAGYTEYAPTKHAIRGLADCLRNELLLYDIKVHCFFPGTIESPGFEIEERTKPQITRSMEGPSSPQSPKDVAMALYNGLKKGQYFITSDLVGDLCRAGTRGCAPTNNVIIDALFGMIFWLFIFPFTFLGDKLVYDAGPSYSIAKSNQAEALLSKK